MLWFTLALLGFTINAVVNVLDKFVLEKTTIRPAVFVFYSTIFAWIFFLALPWVGFLQGMENYLAASMSGLFFVGGLWASYTAIQKSEASHVNPLIGAMIPIFSFIFNSLLGWEKFSIQQIIAIIFLVVGSLIISREKSREHHGWHSGLTWGLIAGGLFALFSLSAKYLYSHTSFTTGFVWSQGMVGVVTTFLLLLPSVRSGLKIKDKSSNNKKSLGGLLLVGVDKFLGLVGLVLVQYAVALGSVTIVYALAGLQYALLIILIILLSKFFPKIFREEFARGEMRQEFTAILFIAVGLFILVL